MFYNKFESFFRNQRLFRIFLYSYLVILIIPTLIGSISYIKSSKEFKKQLEEYNIAMLMQAAQVIDGYLYGVDQLMTNVAVDSRIMGSLLVQGLATDKDYYNFLQIIDELARYRSVNNFIDNIYVYYKNINAIFTYSGKYDPQVFFEDVTPYDGINYDEWMKNHEKTFFKQYIPASYISKGPIKKKVLSYMHSLTFPGKNQPLGTAVIIINEEKIENLLKNNIGNLKNGFLLILDKNDDIIMSMGNDTYLDKTKYTGFGAKRTITYELIDGKEVMISYISSEFSQWKYISVIPTQTVMQKLNDIKVLTIAVTLVSIIIGLIFSYIMAKRNYMPINRIAKNLMSLVGNQQNLQRNELTFIESATNTTIQEYRSIKRAMKVQKPIIKANALANLVKGNIKNYENMRESLLTLDIAFEFDCFIVMTIHVDECHASLSKDALEQREIIKFVISNVIEELANEEYSAFSVDTGWEEIALIINCQDDCLPLMNSAFGIAYRAKDFLESKYQTYISVGVGTVHKGIAGINGSYSESLKALEYKVIKGDGSIISYSDIGQGEPEYIYSLDTEMMILNSIKVGDAEKVLNLLEYIFTLNFKNGNVSLEYARCLFFDIMSTALKGLKTVEIKYEQIFGKDFQPVDRIIQCSTLNEMHETMKYIFQKVCDYIRKNKRSRSYELKEKALDYIHNNYQDSSLSLERVADVLNVNYSYLSNYFKEQVGDNFASYLNKIRVEKAKELLQSTNLTLEEISTMIGYVNAGALNRAFKRVFQITPGQCRDYEQRNTVK